MIVWCDALTDVAGQDSRADTVFYRPLPEDHVASRIALV